MYSAVNQNKSSNVHTCARCKSYCCMFTRWFLIRSSTASTLYLYSSRHSIKHLRKRQNAVGFTRRVRRVSWLSRTQSRPDSPGDLFVAPLRPVGASVLEGFEHQQVALSVAQQQVGVSPAGGVQEAFHSLGRTNDLGSTILHKDNFETSLLTIRIDSRMR